MPADVNIRRYRPDDVDAVCEAVLESHAELSVWMPWCHAKYSRDDAAAWVESRPEAWERGAEWSFVIEDASAVALHEVQEKAGLFDVQLPRPERRTPAARMHGRRSPQKPGFPALLGACGIHRLELRNGVGEIGYWVRTSATGRGVATQAVRQLCRWAFEEKSLHRLEIVASVENVASCRVAEKAGGVREGILRGRLLLHGRRHDAALYAIVNDRR